MRILDVTPMLTVAAMEPAIAFYSNTLGFERLASTDAWACLGSNRVEMMVTLPNAHCRLKGR